MVYINDFSIISPIGNDKKTVADNLFSAHDGLIQTADKLKDRTTYVGKVHHLKPLPESTDPMFKSRNNQLIYNAFIGIEPMVKQYLKEYPKERIAIILGTSVSGTLEIEEHHHWNIEDMAMISLESPAEFLKSILKTKGPAYVVSTACTSASKAMISAKRLIEADLADIVITGGVDSLCKLSVQGFDSLGALSYQKCVPFSAQRTGINVGEGAALFILSKTKKGITFAGYGETTDFYHLSSPDPEGKGAYQAMLSACQMADIVALDVDYINAHGTATELNDAMESLALSRLYPEKEKMPFISSTKALVGHCLGASGALEAAFLCLFLSQTYNPQNQVPPHAGDQNMDPILPWLHLAKKTDRIKHDKHKIAMSCNYAFGGNNNCIILKENR